MSEVLNELPVTFFYRTVVSNSLRKFVRRNASHYKSMEELGRTIKDHWIDEFFDRLIDCGVEEKLPVMTPPRNYRNLLKSIRELEFDKNFEFFQYKRDRL